MKSVKFTTNAPAYYRCDICGIKRTQSHCVECKKCVCLNCMPDHYSRHIHGLIEPHARASILERIKQWLRR